MLDPILEQILSKAPDTATADFEARRDGFLVGQQYEADQHREMRMHCAKVEDELLRLKKDYDALKEKYEAPLDGSFDVYLAWRQLKEYVEQSIESYESGEMCSVAESIHGSCALKAVHKKMCELEGSV